MKEGRLGGALTGFSSGCGAHRQTDGCTWRGQHKIKKKSTRTSQLCEPDHSSVSLMFRFGSIEYFGKGFFLVECENRARKALLTEKWVTGSALSGSSVMAV